MNKELMSRRKFIAGVAAVGASSLLLSADMAMAAEPTLEETVAWLKEKLIKDGSFFLYLSYSYLDVRLIDKTLVVTIKIKYGTHYGYDVTDIETTYYPLNKISKVSEPLSVESCEFINLICSGGEKNIREETKKITKNVRENTVNEKEFSNLLTVKGITLPNRELAKRVAKALSHAITLCGGTDAPKEPF